MGSAMRKIGPELARKISSGNHAKIDLVAEFGKDLRRPATDSIAARFVNPWPYSNVLLDNLAQPYQLFALEFVRQVTRVGVFVCLSLKKGRIVPRLQVRTNFAAARLVQFPDNLIGLRCAAYRIV